MVLIKSIIRPEKCDCILEKLLNAGFSAVTKMDVYGHGKQKGIRIGSVFYDELPKTMVMMVVKDEEKDEVIKIIMSAARTDKNGNPGDGRIFVSPVDSAYTISSESKGL